MGWKKLEKTLLSASKNENGTENEFIHEPLWISPFAGLSDQVC